MMWTSKLKYCIVNDIAQKPLLNFGSLSTWQLSVIIISVTAHVRMKPKKKNIATPMEIILLISVRTRLSLKKKVIKQLFLFLGVSVASKSDDCNVLNT